jgi:uncharacterized protein
METRRLTAEQARRLAVRAQLLDAGRPTDLVELVDHLTLLQIDPTAAIAPSADLVAWSRLGSSYRPDHLRQALEDNRSLFELNAFIRPMSAVGLMLADMAASPTREQPRQWIEANDRFRRDILDRLEDSGPLLSRDIPDTSVVPWGSTGWTNNRNVTQMLEFLTMRGEVAISGRRGRQRIWDLADHVYPTDVEAVPAEEAMRLRDARRLRALGIAREQMLEVPGEPYAVGSAGEPAEVEGVPGLWRVDPEALERSLDEQFQGRAALLSPFDRLVHDRARARALFDFEYVLEMYKPKPQRRWGYFALPVLHHDRLVGKLDAAADRKTGVLQVHAIHEDTPFTRQMSADVRAEIVDLAKWLGLEPDGI